MASKAEAIDLLSSDDDHRDVPSSIEEWSAPQAKRRRLSPEALSIAPLKPPTASSKNTTTLFKQSKLAVTGLQDFGVLDEDDPIEFTSSVHPTVSQTKPSTYKHGAHQQDEVSSSDDDLPDLFTEQGGSNALSISLSSRTAALLATLQPGPTSCKTSTSDAATQKKKSPLAEEERQARGREKDQAKQAKSLERDEAKTRRAKEKEEELEQRKEKRAAQEVQKREATAFTNANKADKIKKEVSTPEMILDMPESLLGSKHDHGIHENCKRLNVDVTTYQSPVPNLIKWRRKTKAVWNAEREFWEPLPSMVVKDEPHILCLVPAKTFVSLALASKDAEDSLDKHVARLRSAYTHTEYGALKMIYMIEGLVALLKASKNAENRAFQAQVRGEYAIAGNGSAGGGGARKRKQVAIIDDAAVEAALLRLQVRHRCLIHHTIKDVDTVNWIVAFTQHISTVPYRYVISLRPSCLYSTPLHLPSFYLSFLPSRSPPRNHRSHIHSQPTTPQSSHNLQHGIRSSPHGLNDRRDVPEDAGRRHSPRDSFNRQRDRVSVPECDGDVASVQGRRATRARGFEGMSDLIFLMIALLVWVGFTGRLGQAWVLFC